MNFLSDLRYAARLFSKQPAFTAVAALNARSRDWCEHRDLQRGECAAASAAALPAFGTTRSLARAIGYFRVPVPSVIPNYLDWRAAQRSLTDLSLFRRGGVNLSAAMADSYAGKSRLRPRHPPISLALVGLAPS